METILQEMSMLIIIIVVILQGGGATQMRQNRCCQEGSWGTCFHGDNNHFNWHINYM